MVIKEGLIKNVLNNEKVRDKAEEIALKKAGDIVDNLFDNGPEKVKALIAKFNKDKNEFKEKYNNLSKLVIDPTAVFISYVDGIEEADSMIIYYNHLIKSLKNYHPTDSIKKNSLTKNQKKWTILKTSLRVNLTNKLLNECLKVYRTKVESPFFINHPEIHNEIISCKTEEEVKEFYEDIFKRYNLTKTSAIESLQSYKD